MSELKEGAWLEAGLALLRFKKVQGELDRKTSKRGQEDFSRKVDGRRRDYSMLMGRISRTMSSLPEGGRHRKAEALPLPRMVRSLRREVPEVFRTELEQKARTSKKAWKWQRGIVEHPLSGSQRSRRRFSLRKWESEKHKSWGMPAQGFKGHVATDGSLLGIAGEGHVVGAAAQLDYDEEMGPLRGMYGSMEAEFEVRRTIKRAGLTALLCLLRKVCGPIKILVDNKGIIGGLRRGVQRVY